MKKVSIIYWSNGGNVEIIANAICEGASIGDVQSMWQMRLFKMFYKQMQ